MAISAAGTPGQITTSDTYTDLQYNWENALADENAVLGKVIPTGISEINFDPGTANLGNWSGDGTFMRPVDLTTAFGTASSLWVFPVRQHLSTVMDYKASYARPRYVLRLRALRAEGSVQRDGGGSPEVWRSLYPDGP